MPDRRASGRATRADAPRAQPTARRRPRARRRRAARRHLRGRRAARARRLARRPRPQRPRRLRRRVVRRLRRRRARERHLAGADVPAVHRRRRRRRADAARFFLRPAFGEFARCLAALPALVAARDAAVPARSAPPRRAGVVRDALARRFPTACSTTARSTASWRACSAAPGRTNDFRTASAQALPRRDQPRHRRLGHVRRARHATTCRSRARSRRRARCRGCSRRCAIDGEHYVDGALNKTLHASVALDEGVGLLLCVNPLVPFDGRPRRARAARA